MLPCAIPAVQPAGADDAAMHSWAGCARGRHKRQQKGSRNSAALHLAGWPQALAMVAQELDLRP